MYPRRELDQLAVHKAALRRDIAAHRDQCARAAARVAQPLVYLDRMLAIWRQLSPFARFLPLALLVLRLPLPRLRILRSLVTWGPLVFNVVRSLRGAARTRLPAPRTSRTPLLRLG